MSPADVISHFGSRAETAKALGIGRAAICKWVKKGEVPPLSAWRIQELTKGALKFDYSKYTGWHKRRTGKRL